MWIVDYQDQGLLDDDPGNSTVATFGPFKSEVEATKFMTMWESDVNDLGWVSGGPIELMDPDDGEHIFEENRRLQS